MKIISSVCFPGDENFFVRQLGNDDLSCEDDFEILITLRFLNIKKYHRIHDPRCKMPSKKEYLDFVLEQLSGLNDVSYRAMMGEYILYCGGKIIGGIYDDRLLVKPTISAQKLMPDAVKELPYEGAKEMLLVENIDDREFLCGLFKAMADELPEARKKKK